jgi:hypothetical protein
MVLSSDQFDIAERNRLRKAAGLPLLDPTKEAARLAGVKAQADFEVAFASRRDKLADRWADNADGWMSNYGRYIEARRQTRSELASK